MAYYLVIMQRNKYVRDIEYKISKTVEANNPTEAHELAENIANSNLSDEDINNHGKYIAVEIQYIHKPKDEPEQGIKYIRKVIDTAIQVYDEMHKRSYTDNRKRIVSNKDWEPIGQYLLIAPKLFSEAIQYLLMRGYIDYKPSCDDLPHFVLNKGHVINVRKSEI